MYFFSKQARQYPWVQYGLLHRIQQHKMKQPIAIKMQIPMTINTIHFMANLKVVSLHSFFSVSQTLPSLQTDSLVGSNDSLTVESLVGSRLLKWFWKIEEKSNYITSFVFLGELKTPKIHFQINRPLSKYLILKPNYFKK